MVISKYHEKEETNLHKLDLVESIIQRKACDTQKDRTDQFTQDFFPVTYAEINVIVIKFRQPNVDNLPGKTRKIRVT